MQNGLSTGDLAFFQPLPKKSSAGKNMAEGNTGLAYGCAWYAPVLPVPRRPPNTVEPHMYTHTKLLRSPASVSTR